MNIFLFTETKSGCYKWRGKIPGKYLTKRGHSVQLFDERDKSYAAPDVMVFYRAHYVEAARLVEWCKKNSIRVVFDTDDALDLVPRDNLHFHELQPRIPVYTFLLENADVVTTTTPTLAEYLRTWNPNVIVIPNSVDPDEWTPQPKKDAGVRIGWTGSPTHFGDLAVAMDAVRDLQKKHPFTFVLQGICTEPTLEALRDELLEKWGKAVMQTPIGKSLSHFMGKLSGIKYEFHPGVPLNEHAETVCGLTLDIGIAPLDDNRFNRHKSCIKFYEYAMSGAITVASHVLPYSAEVSLTTKNRRDAWKEKLEFALTADRAQILKEQRDWVLTHRNIEKTVELWEQTFAGESIPIEPALQAC